MLRPTPLRAELLPTVVVHGLPSGSSRSPAAHRQNSARLCRVLGPVTLPLLFAIGFAVRRVCGLEHVEAVMIERVSAVIATVHRLLGTQVGKRQRIALALFGYPILGVVRSERQ